MQELPSCKAIANGLHVQQLNCFTRKYRMAVRIMKLTAIILLSACLQLSARGLSQTITLNLKDAPIQKVFKEIKRQTGYTFFVDMQWLDKAKKVTIEAKNLPLNQVLDLCFRDQPFTYSISGKTITIGPKKIEKQEKSSALENPPIDIKGRVVDANGEPISNATVSVKGSTKSTITNSNGEFTLMGVEDNAVLIITHVQYQPENIALNGRSAINATMQIKINSLDELQIIAYGTTTKRLNTGNIASVKGSELEKQPVSNPLLALQGRVPGLFIEQAAGMPGAGVTVRIQGLNSIKSGNDPLYIIDGVPYISQFLPTISNVLGGSGGAITNGISPGGGNPLSILNPADIESIEVLKDADATSIYGSRAANGAILITTKKGKAGQTKVNFNLQTGWGKVAHHLNLLNTDQYLEMRHQAKANDNATVSSGDYDINGFWDTTRSTDWQKELIGGTAKYTDAQASVSGGNASTSFFAGMGYHKETTVFPADLSDEKKSLHFSINNTSPNQRFRFLLSGNYLMDDNHLSGTDPTSDALQLPPDAPALRNADGTLNWAMTPFNFSSWPNTNPLSYFYNRYKLKSTNAIGNALVSYEIIHGLEIKSSFGYNNLQIDETNLYPLDVWSPDIRPYLLRQTTFGNNKVNTWIVEPQISYKTKIGQGQLEVLAGATRNQTTSNRVVLTALGFTSDVVMEDIKSAPKVSVSSSVASTYNYSAGFGRLNYNWDNKYVINLTARRDGSSRFGSANLFHNFASVGGAWIFSSEKLIHDVLPFLSLGKLRGSYGTTGNDQIGDYQFMNLYTSVPNVGVPYQNSVGILPNRLTNPYLQWEETKKLQIGLDLGFLNDRVLVNANYFRNRSSNQLLDYPLPIITGFYTQTVNLPATVQNSGFEFAANAAIFSRKNFTWSANFNISAYKNKLVSFDNLASSTYASTLVVGQSILIRKVYDFRGVDPATGLYAFSNLKGGTTSRPDTIPNSNSVYMDLNPQFFGGFGNTFTYKGIQLDFLFQFVKQKAQNYSFGNRPGLIYLNQPDWVMNRWQKAGDDASIQKFNSNHSADVAFNDANGSNGAWGDASYIRLKNVSLSWQVPALWVKKAHIQNFRIYVQGQNLFTITNYKGLDPETKSLTRLPPLRVITTGVQVTL